MKNSKELGKEAKKAIDIPKSLGLLSKHSARQRAMARQFRWMEKGFDLGKILVKRREDIYL